MSQFRLTHPDRVLWPDVGLTKQGLAEFYAEIADWVLPHVVDRPLSLVRCPSGSGKECFFQKHAWEGMSKAVRRKPVGDDEVLFIEDLEGLDRACAGQRARDPSLGLDGQERSRSPIGSPSTSTPPRTCPGPP